VSGTSVVFDNIPQTYGDLLIMCTSLSHDSGSNQTFRAEISVDNGSSYSSTFTIGALTGGANSNVIVGEFRGYALDRGFWFSGNLNNTGGAASPGVTAGLAQTMYHTAHTGGCDAIRFSPSSGNFDAGTIAIYGK
jgi:hypothetical protein